MREYRNQIDNKIIKTAFTEEEIQEFKEIAKAYDEIVQAKRSAERKIKEKLEGYVIGELKDINLLYIAYTEEIIFQYSFENEKQKEETLSEKIKGFFK